MAAALVPYGDTRIVLRHNDSVVLYDASSRRLVVRRDTGAPAADDHSLDFGQCPACGRPYHDASGSAARQGEGSRGDAPPEYFRMLAESSHADAAPPSPVRRLAQPVSSASGSPSSSAAPSGLTSVEQSPSRKPGAAFRTGGAVGRGFAAESDTAAATAAPGIDPLAFSEGYFGRFFVSQGELGRGGKGVVLLARHVIDRVDLGQYAIKRIPVGNNHQWLIRILQEVQLLSSLAHENLVQYKHVWLEEVKITTFGPSVPCAFVMQMYCNGGDLHHYICGGSKRKDDSKEAMKEMHRRRNSKLTDDLPVKETGLRRLTLDEIHSFFKQITAGINYLHQKNFIHRDLKPSNCLLHNTGSELRVLVSDFGEVQMGDEIREGTGATGTISYCAPEVLKLDPQTGVLGAFTTRSDIFSLGMVLHFLCFGQLPYHSADGIDEDDEDVELLKDEISRWSGFEEERKLRSDLPLGLYQHLSRLLSTNPGHRPSATDILAGLESIGVDGRLEGEKLNNTIGKGSTHLGRSKEGFSEHRRASRVGGSAGERARSNSKSSSALAHSSSSLRRPTMLTRENTAVSGETAIATESSSEDEMNKSAFGRDSLVLRSNPASRASSPMQSQSFPRSPPPVKLITAGGENDDTLSRWRRAVRSRTRIGMSSRTVQLVKLLIFVAKLLSLYIPCLPSATNPRIALPLLALSLADFAGPPFDGSLLSFVLVLLHVLVLLNGRIMGADMCTFPRDRTWWEVND